MNAAVMNTYGRTDVRFTHGEGGWLYDESGRRYLDLLGGIAVCALGHAHPAVTRAVSEQAARVVHTSNLYRIEAQERLAEALTRLSGMECVFFCNSGAEANEAAIKIARAHGHGKGIELPQIIVARSSFHGRTLATLSATGNEKVHVGFEPLVQGFVRVPYGDLEAVAHAGRDNAGVVAVMVEPILGEGGVVLPPDDYLPGLRSLCDEHGWLLMLDEVQTGMGRTGAWFAHQPSGIVPDVMMLAKALGNGVPIGACLARGAAAQALGPGSHGSTFGGNPLACSAALAVIDTIESEGLLAGAARGGERLMNALSQALAGVNCVREVRGRGMMIGIAIDRDCPEIVALAMEQGLLINVAAGNVVRLLPPYILDDDEIDHAAATLAGVIRQWNSGQ